MKSKWIVKKPVWYCLSCEREIPSPLMARKESKGCPMCWSPVTDVSAIKNQYPHGAICTGRHEFSIAEAVAFDFTSGDQPDTCPHCGKRIVDNVKKVEEKTVTNNKKMDAHALLLENVAAVSAEVHSHPHYKKFYDKVAPRVGGFPGIYRLCIDFARAMTEWETSRLGSDMLQRIEWIDLVDACVDRAVRRIETEYSIGWVTEQALLLADDGRAKAAVRERKS
jgi:DNA-directed RNA polymerase subunit RPC12/RpoP